MTHFPLFWIPLLPLLGAVVLILFGRRLGRERAPWVAIGAVGISLVLVLDGFVRLLPQFALMVAVWQRSFPRHVVVAA